MLDWVPRQAYASSGKGIQWSLVKKLKDLDFADDLALLSRHLQDLQDRIESLEEVAKQVGLKIGRKKTKVMSINTKQDTPIAIGGSQVEDVKEFVYLGSKISQAQTKTSNKELGKPDKSLPSFVQSAGLIPSHPIPNSESSILTSSQCYCTVPKLGELQVAAQRGSSVSYTSASARY